MADEQEEPASPLDGLSEEEINVLRAYMMFSSGDGQLVYEDLMYTFYSFESDENSPFRVELSKIPHPYQEYVKAGCRLVMDKIRTAVKFAEETR